MLIVEGTSLYGRGREAPKSLGVLEVIEVSANIGRLRVPLCDYVLASSFYRLRRGGLPSPQFGAYKSYSLPFMSF